MEIFECDKKRGKGGVKYGKGVNSKKEKACLNVAYQYLHAAESSHTSNRSYLFNPAMLQSIFHLCSLQFVLMLLSLVKLLL